MIFGDSIYSVASLFGQLAPWHLFSYSTLLGMQLYQTFIVTKIAYITLPRPAFHSLQKRIFPIYFRVQTALVVLTALSFPAHGPRSLVQNKADWIPFLVAGVTSVLNMVVYGPRTSKLMVDRVHQKTRDGMNGVDDGETSPEMSTLNRAFKRDHAMSIHLNAISLGAILFYGLRLAVKVKVD